MTQQNENMDDILKKVTEAYMAQNAQVPSSEEPKSKKLHATMKQTRNKLVLWAMVSLIAMGSLVYMGVAWYTRISSTHAITFDVAEYDLAVNDQTDDEFIVNVYTYKQVKEGLAAPGTSGYIPLKLSARHSDISVDYSIIIKNIMLPELQDHIRFFYLTDSTGKPLVSEVTGTDADGNLTTKEDYFLKDPGNVPSGYRKNYIPKRTTKADGTLADLTGDALVKSTIKGTITMEKQALIYIYWEWHEDAEAAYTSATKYANSNNDIITEHGKTATWSAYCDAWDALDTDIGRYPAKYAEAMLAQIICTGVQSDLDLKEK